MVDISREKLQLARQLGAGHTINARETDQVVETIREISGGGVQLSIDALGSTETCVNSILGLAKRGRHIQIGLMTAEHRLPAIPMGVIIAHELEILGSHGMQAHAYPEMWALITSGRIRPKELLGRTIGLKEAARALMEMDQHDQTGVTVIDPLKEN